MCCIICQKKRVLQVEKQMKRSIFSGTCTVDKWYRNFRAFRSKLEKGNTSKGITFFPNTFHRDEPFHLNFLWNYRKFHSNGKRSSFPVGNFPMEMCFPFTTFERSYHLQAIHGHIFKFWRVKSQSLGGERT